MFESIISQIESGFHPNRIILFGSFVKGTSKQGSDIDLCVVAETNDKRNTLSDMYYDLSTDIPVDIVLYTPEEWVNSLRDPCSFASQINREGVVLYG